MSFENVRAPYLLPLEIKKVVDNLREKFSVLQEFPIDIELFIEKDLGVEVIPEHGLCERAGVEAMITRDGKFILIDLDKFSNDTYYQRLRFSLAHELGHKFLHADWIKQHIPNEAEAWITFMGQLSDITYRYMEIHANNFAGMLLAPSEELVPLLKSPKSIIEVARYFQVSIEVIKKRLSVEDVSMEFKDVD